MFVDGYDEVIGKYCGFVFFIDGINVSVMDVMLIVWLDVVIVQCVSEVVLVVDGVF